MLMKRAAVGPSHIEGWGLLATEQVPGGEVIDESPLLITRQRIPRSFEAHVYRLDDGRFAMPCGDGVFTNHASEPNAEPRLDRRRRVIVLVARRAIRIGEEVTIDYGQPLACTAG